MSVLAGSLWNAYFEALQHPFTKICKLEFLQPDGTVAFVLDSNPKNPRSSAFIQEGTLTVNLQNGMRRQATVTLANADGEFDYNVNNRWFGQQIRLNEGLILADGTEFYIPQGVFYVENPEEVMMPNERIVRYSLVDKWAYLDGTLFGQLDGIYQVPMGSSIFGTIASILLLPRGNGLPVDSQTPMFTNYYNGKTQTLPDGSNVSLTTTPYTYICDGDGCTYADIVLEMNTMLAGWIGYNPIGALALDPSQDDILDISKPVQWSFSPSDQQFLGATYQIKNTDVYNDIIIKGEGLNDYQQVAARATNLDPASDTNVNLIGKKTHMESAAGYYTTDICQSLANFKLKRQTVLQKSVTIRSTQMFHIRENELVTIARPDRGGLVERHLVTGFTRPLGQTGEMTIQATSTNDFPIATITNPYTD